MSTISRQSISTLFFSSILCFINYFSHLFLPSGMISGIAEKEFLASEHFIQLRFMLQFLTSKHILQLRSFISSVTVPDGRALNSKSFFHQVFSFSDCFYHLFLPSVTIRGRIANNWSKNSWYQSILFNFFLFSWSSLSSLEYFCHFFYRLGRFVGESLKINIRIPRVKKKFVIKSQIFLRIRYLLQNLSATQEKLFFTNFKLKNIYF